MCLLALFQPLYHQPIGLGVTPLAKGEKAKMPFKPRKGTGEEEKHQTCEIVEEH